MSVAKNSIGINLDILGLENTATPWFPSVDCTFLVSDNYGLRSFPAIVDAPSFQEPLDKAVVVPFNITTSFQRAGKIYYISSPNPSPTVPTEHGGGIFSFDGTEFLEVVKYDKFPDSNLKVISSIETCLFVDVGVTIYAWRPIDSIADYASSKDTVFDLSKDDVVYNEVGGSGTHIDASFKELLNEFDEPIIDAEFSSIYFVYLTPNFIFVGTPVGALAQIDKGGTKKTINYGGINVSAKAYTIPFTKGGLLKFIAYREGVLYIASDYQLTTRKLVSTQADTEFPFAPTSIAVINIGGISPLSVVNNEVWGLFVGQTAEGGYGMYTLTPNPIRVSNPLVDSLLITGVKSTIKTFQHDNHKYLIIFTHDEVIIGQNAIIAQPLNRPIIWSRVPTADEPYTAFESNYYGLVFYHSIEKKFKTLDNTKWYYAPHNEPMILTIRFDKSDIAQGGSPQQGVTRGSGGLANRSRAVYYEPIRIQIRAIGHFPRNLRIKSFYPSLNSYEEGSTRTSVGRPAHDIIMSDSIEINNPVTLIRLELSYDPDRVASWEDFEPLQIETIYATING